MGDSDWRWSNWREDTLEKELALFNFSMKKQIIKPPKPQVKVEI